MLQRTIVRQSATAHLATLIVAISALCLSGCGKKADPAAAAKTAGEAAKTAGEAAKTAGTAAKADKQAEAPAAKGARRVFFVEPKDGANVRGVKDADGKIAVSVKFGVDGMTVKPAGTDEPNTGHHHIVIDGAPIPPDQPVPMDEMHIHYGKGQTEAVVALTPGAHKLTMQFANFAHQSYGPMMAATIEVTVSEKETMPMAEAPPTAPAGKPATGPAADKAAAAAAAAAGTPVPANKATVK